MSESATQSELGQVLAEIKSMRSDIQAMDKKLDIHIVKTEEQFNTVQAEIKAVRTEIQAVRTELKTEIQAVRTELKTEIQAVRIELKTEVQAVRTELKTELKAIDDKVTDLSDRQKIVDSRLWGFIVALVGAIIAYLVKLSFFDRV